MKQFGIVRWGETIMHSVHAETISEASTKLEALGYTGFIIEILNVEAVPTGRRSSVPPVSRETHWSKACDILSDSQKQNGPVLHNGKPIIVGSKR